MSNKKTGSMLDESLSALMDGEAQEMELRRILHSVPDEPALRNKWARYQLVSSLLHQQSCLPIASLEIADTVQRAIGNSELLEENVEKVNVRHRSITRFAVAASVALAVVAGVQWGQHQSSHVSELPMTASTESSAAKNKPSTTPLLLVGQQTVKDSAVKEAQQDLFLQYGFDRAVMDSSSGMPLTPAAAKINAR